MKQLILLVLTLSLAAAAVDGQTTNAPLTYFAAFNATPDTLLIRGSSTIGTLDSKINYPVEIRVERLTNPATTNSVYAVSLRTRFNQQTTQIDYIDYDELDGLIRGVQFISQATSTVTPLDNFETVFRTRGGLSIAKVGRVNKITIAMTPGYANAARNQMASFVLDDFGRYLTAAKAKIDALVASGQ